MRATFDRFTLDSEQRILLDGASPVHVGPKAFQLLETLVRCAPRVLDKRELCDQIWPGTFVNESSLAGLVNELRDAMGDEARNPRFIRTVHGVGYAFCGELRSGARPAVARLMFRGRELPLYEGVNVLGRDASADVVIDDATVSRRHASITMAEDATLRDLDSKNGTFVDGERLTQPVPLADGQSLVLGDARVEFRSSARRSTVTVSRMRARR